MEKIKIIGDLKITETSGGNSKHSGFWHSMFCYCFRSESETIHCNPSVTYEKEYYPCGFWVKKKYETIEVEE